ncbi:hypothetical protein HYW21_00260 [Candidatus Woesearchaeota archaeon]|nr:hypothetical protein [Candidatus Woesearchaeota archaeon]
MSHQPLEGILSTSETSLQGGIGYNEILSTPYFDKGNRYHAASDLTSDGSGVVAPPPIGNPVPSLTELNAELVRMGQNLFTRPTDSSLTGGNEKY